MKKPAVQVAAMIAAMALVKAALSVELELTSAESYFWMQAKHPALGYFDHPGLTAWMIGLSTALFGESVLAVRLFTIAAGALMTWFIFLAARRIYDERAARLAAFLVGLAPLPWAWGAQALSYAPLLLFWSATLWALSHALSGGRPAWWAAAGMFLGLSMLGEFHGVFLGVGVLLFLLFTPERRGWLRRKEPYLAVVLAIAAFSPTIVWNAMNGWESFRYQGTSRFGEHQFSVHKLWSWPVSQILLLTPFVCLWVWGSGLRALARWRRIPWQDRFLASMSMPVLLFFLSVMFLGSARGHWAAPGYLAAIILAASTVERGGVWGKRLIGGTLIGLLAGYLLAPGVLAFWPRAQITGWGQLANEVKNLRPDFVMARDYHHASQMAYQARPVPAIDFTAVGEPSKNFRHWWRGADLAGKDAVVVFDAAHYPAGLDLVAKHFARIEEPERWLVGRPSLGPFGKGVEEFLLVKARGYRPSP